jgi:hypothetical protein
MEASSANGSGGDDGGKRQRGESPNDVSGEDEADFPSLFSVPRKRVIHEVRHHAT